MVDFRRFRKHAITSVGFVAAAAVLLAILGVGLETACIRLDANLVKIRQLSKMDGAEHDLLFVGDSTVLEGINPAVIDALLKTSSWNLATGGQSLVESEFVLREYLARNRVPEVVVLGVNINLDDPQVLPNPNLRDYFSAQRRAEFDRQYAQVRGQELTTAFKAFNAVPAYRYRAGLDHALKFFAGGRGRIPELVRGHAAFHFSRSAAPGRRHPVTVDVESLVSISGLLESHGIELLLLEMPNHPGYSELSEGRDEAIASIRAALPDTEFYSFNPSGGLGFADEDWLSLNHLNASGARRFSRQFLAPWLETQLSGHITEHDSAVED